MREPWRHKAACADLPNADTLFFPERTGPTRESRAAMQVCARCPVQQPCPEWAVTHYEVGIWGGTGHVERMQMRRETTAENRRRRMTNKRATLNPYPQLEPVESDVAGRCVNTTRPLATTPLAQTRKGPPRPMISKYPADHAAIS